ncbi:MAG: glycosyltransferase [Nitrospira sp.]|nr:glycosyltransferase [Nitrospira sp.]
MTISVILPTLDEAQTLPQTLARTLALDFDEVLVVDGGSRDRTQDIVRELQAPGCPSHVDGSEPDARNRTLRLLTAPPGRAAQMNAGASAGRGEVLLFLHADTQLPPDAKPAILQALREPACVGGRFDLRFERDKGLAWLISRLINLRSRSTGIATGDQALFVRREVFERMGGFTAIPIMEDVDFSRRLKRMGRIAALRAQVVTSYRRWESCGPIRTILLMWSLRLLYWLGVSPQRLSRLYVTVR